MNEGFGGTATMTAAVIKGANSMTDVLSEEHQAWLEARGIDLEVAMNGLSTDRQSPGGRDLVIPYIRRGKVINRKYRGPGKHFRQDAGAPRAFWNEDCLRDPTLADEPLLITEGEPDTLAAIQAGFLRTVSVSDGAKSNLDFVGDLWPLLKDATHVILCGDGDEPGQQLNAELARHFGAARCARVTYPQGAKDLGEHSAYQGRNGRQGRNTVR
jgi:twinkle protein